MSPQIYAVLEPVHLLPERVHNDFIVRQIAREVGRQLREGTDAAATRAAVATCRSYATLELRESEQRG
ncbi:hypothetical protein ACW4TU_45185 (plasmid) [Streptomyces sp. QTS52]